MAAIGRDLTIRPVNVPANMKHPGAPDPRLPTHEFCFGLIAPKGAGKTTLIANLLHFYRGYFHNIYVFSPTVENDEKWAQLKKEKFLIENKPLKRWIKAEQQKRAGAFKDQIVQDAPLGAMFESMNTNEKEEFDGIIPKECFYHRDYTHADLDAILDRKNEIIHALKKHDKPKYLADRDLFIFDDQVGSPLFRKTQSNKFIGFNTRHRHYSASIIMVAQAYKEIPVTIRVNFTCMIIFFIANSGEIKKIYEENQMGLTEEEWMEVYQHATREPYHFLFIDSSKPIGKRCMKNFDSFILTNGTNDTDTDYTDDDDSD